MSTDFRALFDEHADELCSGDGIERVMTFEAFQAAVSAALAQPEAEEPTDQHLFLKIDALLDGIDRDECDPKGGWWETSDGAKFGRIKLRELKELIAQHQQGRTVTSTEDATTTETP